MVPNNQDGAAEAAPERQAILASLREIMDPCSVQAGRPMNIVQMGLIGELEIRVDGKVRCSLVLTEAACWFTKDLIAFAKDRIELTQGVREAEVVLDTQEIWTADRIDPPLPFLTRFPITPLALEIP